MNCCAYIVSQWVWLLYIVIPIVTSAAIGGYCPPTDIFSAHDSFNESEDPQIFTHLTDIHINANNTVSMAIVEQIMEQYEVFKPELILNTGDIADNYNPVNPPRYGTQNEENWKAYRRITDKHNFSIIECAGNHDFYGVYSFDSPRSYFLDYSHTFTRNNTLNLDSFRTRIIKHGKYNIVVINTFRFPGCHPPLMFWSEITREHLDYLEDLLPKLDNVILLGHYPISMFNSVKSSSGKLFQDIIEESNIMIYLSGHTHPKSAEIQSYKGVIEVVGAPGESKYKYAMLTFDNFCQVYTQVHCANPPNVLVTHPVPKASLNKRTSFASPTGFIRVLTFGDRDFDISVSGSVNGKLKFVRKVKDEISLYSLPYDIFPGEHKIVFSGDYNDTLEFAIGPVYRRPMSRKPVIPLGIGTIHIMFYITAVAFLIIFFPITFFSTESTESWIETDSSEHHWLTASFLGFGVVRTRISSLPLYIRIFIFITVAWSLFGPVSFFETEGHYGFAWSFGYYIDGNFIQAYFATFFAYIYLFLIVLPMILLFSGMSLNRADNTFIGDYVFYCIGAVGAVFMNIFFIVESSGYKLLWLSPCYVIIPIIEDIIILIYYFTVFKKHVEVDRHFSLIPLYTTISQ